MQALARWFMHRYDSSQPTKFKTIGPTPFPSISGAHLLKSSKIKPSNQLRPRLPQIEHVYSSMFFVKKVKPLVAARWERDKGRVAPSGKPFSQVSSSQALTKEMWEAESPEIRQQVHTERQHRYDKAIAEFERVHSLGSATPEEYQQ
jgi:hypothetical protein